MKMIGMIVLAVAPVAGERVNDGMNSQAWYLTGALLSALLLAYLIYALIKPEKF